MEQKYLGYSASVERNLELGRRHDGNRQVADTIRASAAEELAGRAQELKTTLGCFRLGGVDEPSGARVIPLKTAA